MRMLLEVDLDDIPDFKEMKNQRIECPFPDCPDDEVKYSHCRSYLCMHFRTDHDTDHEVEDMFFHTKENYEAWLAERLEETGTSLKIRSSSENGGRRTIHMTCIHEGSYEPKKDGEKRGHKSKKQTGDMVCTAFLKSVTANGEINVQACFQHFGHEINVADLKLTSTQKNVLAELASKGLSNPAIVEEAKKSSNEFSKLFCLLPQDIRNLKDSLGLNQEQLDKVDLESVKKRVQLEDPADGFRHFTLPDENGMNFLLVIITPGHLENLRKYSHKIIILDDTHNVTMYGLKLTTITVVDNNDRGEPAGFLLSSSTTSAEVAVFFQKVKELYPEFRPAFFMSDEANCFWNGFSAVFDSTHTKKVLCRWHLLRSWCKKAKELMMSDKDLLDKTTRALRELIREPRQDRLIHRILSLLTELDESGNAKAKQFSDYFMKYQYNRIGQWSTTSRANIACHTSMFAESWHSVLKGQMGKKRRIRCDKLIAVLLSTSDMVAHRKSVQSKRSMYSGCSRKGQNHQKCRQFKNEEKKYLFIQKEDGSYNVRMEGDNKEYTHSRCNSIINFLKENTHCEECHACAYRCHCDCLFSTAGVACKHIHGVLSYIAKCIRQEELTGENFMMALVNTNLRKQLREGAEELPGNVVKVKNFLKEYLAESSTPTLVERADSRDQPLTARQSMHMESTLKVREKTKRRGVESSNVKLLPKRRLERCSICAAQDPMLHPDTDPQEFESRVTDWKRCVICKSPAHISCALVSKKCPCSLDSSFELFPKNYLDDLDSDEFSE
eukprot:NP_494132.1 Uncharacterized protein CELE_F52C6.14 [Caenorhabditis elegans]